MSAANLKSSNSVTTQYQRRVYLSCMLCRCSGIIQYPRAFPIELGDGVVGVNSKYLAVVICDTCISDEKNNDAVVFYVTSGVEPKYIKFTSAYRETMRWWSSMPTAITYRGSRVLVVKLEYLTKKLIDGCRLYSLEYIDGELYKVDPVKSFFGASFSDD